MKDLNDIAQEAQRRKYPNVPDHALPKPRYTDKTANGLTKAIIDYLRLQGWQAERINTQGRYIDESKTYVDVLGHARRIGTGKYIPTSGQKGSADISATITGRSVKIEVKMKDKQTENQKEFQRQIEASGGIYFIARSWKDFIKWYEAFNQDDTGGQLDIVRSFKYR